MPAFINWGNLLGAAPDVARHVKVSQVLGVAVSELVDVDKTSRCRRICGSAKD